MARGKASLGDKTVLDVLDAAARAVDGVAPAEMLAAARGAVEATMTRMRGQQAKIGRARIFGERSAGLDDPGMLAFREMLRALAACRVALAVMRRGYPGIPTGTVLEGIPGSSPGMT